MVQLSPEAHNRNSPLWKNNKTFFHVNRSLWNMRKLFLTACDWINTFKYYTSADMRIVFNLYAVKERKLQTQRVSPSPLFKHCSRFEPVHLSLSIYWADWRVNPYLSCWMQPAHFSLMLQSSKSGAKLWEPSSAYFWVTHEAWRSFHHNFHLMLRLVSKDWISVGINWTRVAFWPSLSNSWSLFFSFFPSRLLSDLCVFWQAIRVERSRQAPAFLRGEACPPDQWVLDQRTPTLGGSSVPWIPWNAAEL